MLNVRFEGPTALVKELAEALTLGSAKRASFRERNTGIAHLYVDLDDAASAAILAGLREIRPVRQQTTHTRKIVIEPEPSPRQLPPGSRYQGARRR